MVRKVADRLRELHGRPALLLLGLWRPVTKCEDTGMAAKRKSQTHKAKFERCVKSVKKQGDKYNPYAVCNASVPTKKSKKSKGKGRK